MNDYTSTAVVSWKSHLTKGILLAIIGILALAMPVLTGYTINLILGWLLIIGGVVVGLGMLMGKDKGFWPQLILAILLIVVGVMLLGHPATLAALLGIYLLIQGVLAISLWISQRSAKGSGWVGFNGVVSIVLAVLIFSKWPISGLVFIGVLVGLHLLIWGLSEILFALSLKKIS